MEKYTSLRYSEHLQKLNSDGVLFSSMGNNLGGYKDVDLMYPYIIISLCLKGSCRALYDMKEIRVEANDITVLLPGHILRPLDYTEDFSQAWLIFNPERFADSVLKFDKNDWDLINQAPHCHLTDEQAKSLMNILGVISYLVSRPEEELPHRHRLLEAQLSITYEIYLSIRREHDQVWNHDRLGHLYMQFCDLVIAHYKEERNVNYYAALLGYDSRYFSKIFRSYSNGISPLAWIQNYISTQAKRIMSEHPDCTIKEVAFQLGFPTTANFCRYFKRATGMTPQEYRRG